MPLPNRPQTVPPIPSKPWFWASEVAGYLCVSDRTVRRWITRGTLKPILTHRPYKIPRQEVLRHVHTFSEA